MLPEVVLPFEPTGAEATLMGLLIGVRPEVGSHGEPGGEPSLTGGALEHFRLYPTVFMFLQFSHQL